MATVLRDGADVGQRLVHLHFKPLWLYVDAVREFCAFFARATFEDAGVGERVRLVVHELVENGIRHGDERELDLRVERDGDAFVVSVTNTAREEQVVAFESAFRASQEGTPVEAFTKAVQASITLPSGRGGLGLSRVRFEGDVTMSFERQPEAVRVVARGRIG